MLAIIGGTGLTQLENLKITHRQVMRTPYGEPSGPMTFGTINQHEVMFLARHGYGHTIPPHMVNYRANLWALRDQGAQRIVAITSVGGIRDDLVPGTVVIPDQLIDYTSGRDFTYFDGKDRPVTHIDFTLPYNEALRQKLLAAAKRARVACLDGGVHAVTQGPRLETAAEVDRLERDGADMVGMTGMPEAALAKELGMAYATIAVVVNHAAGRGESRAGVPLETIGSVVVSAMEKVKDILEFAVVSDDD
ncbi:MAG: S-methyl-5'-thioinosine phosphorylase [Nitrosomonadales bacterium]|nr:S-methyl-5'-thioinosine phosphorylase [Nitrosomonadales bacterium]